MIKSAGALFTSCNFTDLYGCFMSCWKKMCAPTVAWYINVSYIKGVGGALRQSNVFCQLLRLLLTSPVTVADLPVLFLFLLYATLISLCFTCLHSWDCCILWEYQALIWYCLSSLLFSLSVHILSHIKITPADYSAYWL